MFGKSHRFPKATRFIFCLFSAQAPPDACSRRTQRLYVCTYDVRGVTARTCPPQTSWWESLPSVFVKSHFALMLRAGTPMASPPGLVCVYWCDNVATPPTNMGDKGSNRKPDDHVGFVFVLSPPFSRKWFTFHYCNKALP